MDLVTPGLGLVFWTVISFLALLFILRKFAWGPIINAVDEREQTISDSLEAAEKAKEEMMHLKEDNKQMMREAREQRDQLLRDAQAIKKRMMEEASEEAGKKSAELIAKAQQTIQAEKKLALKELKTQVATLSVQIAEQVLKAELKDTKSQQALVSKMLDDVQLN